MNDIVPMYLPVTVLFLVSFWLCYDLRHKHKNILGYLFKGNNLKYSIISNVGTLFSLTVFLVMGVGIGMAYGSIAFLMAVLGGITGLILARMLVKSSLYGKIFFTSQSCETSNFSIIDLVGESLGKTTKILHGLIILAYLFLFLTLEFALIRLCYSEFFPNSIMKPILFIFIFMFVCFMYTFLGGFKGILRTDQWQLVIIIVATGLIICLYYTNTASAISANLHGIASFKIHKPIPWSLLKCLGIVIYMICWVIGSADFWIRTTCTLENDQELAKKSITISLLIMIFCALIPIFIGVLLGHHYYRARTEVPTLLPFCILEYLTTALPAWPKGLLLAVLAAACFTTVDTFVLASTQTYFVLAKAPQKETDRPRLLQTLKSFYVSPLMFQIIVFFAAISLSLFLTRDNYFVFFASFVHVIFFIFFIILCSVYFKKFYSKNFGPAGMILAIIMAYVIIVYKLKYWKGNFEYIVFLDAACLMGACAVISFYKKLCSPSIRKLFGKI